MNVDYENKLIKLESKEDINLENCYLDEDNSENYQPKYNYFKPDENTLEIRIEIPGNFSYKIEKYYEKDKTNLKISGNKKQDVTPEQLKDNEFNNRKFTNMK